MLTLTVVYTCETHTRCSTRALASHVTLAELLAWAQENCRVGEEIGEVTFRVESQEIEPARPIRPSLFEIKRLSHRLFH